MAQCMDTWIQILGLGIVTQASVSSPEIEMVIAPSSQLEDSRDGNGRL